MEKLTWPQAFNKITEAYIKDEIKPYDGEFCFCGTLAGFNAFVGNSKGWYTNIYKFDDLLEMEFALLSTIKEKTLGGGDIYFQWEDNERPSVIRHPNYEDALFEGMCAALDVLKEIHRSRGEDVDEIQTQFTQRKLQTT